VRSYSVVVAEVIIFMLPAQRVKLRKLTLDVQSDEGKQGVRSAESLGCCRGPLHRYTRTQGITTHNGLP
jgi:hypothetical protein